ncbi:MAG TPA: ABC transporter permease [Terracidiphilus sp.]
MLLQDLRYAGRQLRKSPGFAIVIVLMLALGIGANTAVFSVMNAILLQWLPVNHPEGLTYVRMAKPYGQPPNSDSSGDATRTFTLPAFQALRQRKDVFDELIGYVPLAFTGNVAVRQGELPEEASGDEVSGNFFSGMGVRMQTGRGFSMEDEDTHAAAAVLSYDYWTRRFSRNPNVLGQTLYVRGIPMTIVGVTARGFKGVEPASSTDFWIPLQTRPELNAWGTPVIYESLYGTPKWCALMMMARLRPGVTPAQAQQALQGTYGEVITRAVGPFKSTEWKPLLDFIPARGISGYNDTYREPVRILMGLVGLVLLIACANVAMMLQSRNVVRQREFSLRLAIGAGKSALFGQLLTESLLLVMAGAALGWAFALAATRMLATWSGMETGLSPDRNVLLFTVGISAVAALAFGLIPLRTAMHAPVSAVLRSTSQNATATRSRMLGGRIVLIGQMALCLVLLMAAGLLLRTLHNYAAVDLGMDTHGLLVFGVTPQGKDDSHLFYRNLLDRIAQLPAVESVSMASLRPGTDWSNNNDLKLDGVEQKNVSLRSNDIGPNFFHTMGVPILAGRDIAWSDVQAKDHLSGVCVVNETFVKRFLPHTNPIGHVLGKHVKMTIVGVVRDSKYVGVAEESMPMAYYAVMQAPTLGTMHVEVRTHGDAMAILPTLRQAMAQMYPDVPLEQPIGQQEQFENSYRQQRMFAAMGGFFGLLAVLLVATGLYGTHSFRVSRRTSEIGVRMALGASRGQVLGMVMRESLWVLMAGLAVGIPLTLFAVRPLKAMLYKMSPLDPMSLTLALGLMVLVSAVAAFVPARRAASVDPMQALRTE